MITFIKGLIAKEPARFIAYGSAGAVWLVTRLGGLVGVEVPDEVTLAIATLATFLLTEVIRQFVYSPARVEDMVGKVAAASSAVEAAEVGKELLAEGPPPDAFKEGETPQG